jgi:ribosomal-protein-alanine N-acetyltransferase
MELRLNQINDAEALTEFYMRNVSHLHDWEPRREDGFHSLESWTQRLKERLVEFESGASAHFVSYDSSTDGVVATCSITNIAKGPFQAGNLGYAVCRTQEGKGLMRQLCQYVIDFAFKELSLNRVMANYMPRNTRSEALLNRLGFEREGLARKYLYINGKWEDHVLTSLINPINT